MAEPKQNKALSLDDILSRLEETEALKRQAIEQLLAERKKIDDQLAKLGYTEGAKLSVKKRHRRTKAEIEAEKAKANN